jgi:Uma2 family endonuclease
MITLSIPQGFRVNSQQFEELVFSNPALRLELTPEGELIIMPPTGGSAGRRNFEINGQLRDWVKSDGNGIGFDSSTVFILPNGSRRSPDGAWLQLKRWQNLTSEQQDGFPPIAPDFIIELVSPSDIKNQRYQDLQAKMLEYLDNGVRLGWLINPQTKIVEIYRLGEGVEILENPQTLQGENVLPGFSLDLEAIWA